MNGKGSMRGSRFPLEDLTYDVITIIHAKSKALEVFEQYIEDAEGDNEIKALFEEIRDHDEEYVVQLRQHLGRLIGVADEDTPTGSEWRSKLKRWHG